MTLKLILSLCRCWADLCIFMSFLANSVSSSCQCRLSSFVSSGMTLSNGRLGWTGLPWMASTWCWPIPGRRRRVWPLVLSPHARHGSGGWSPQGGGECSVKLWGDVRIRPADLDAKTESLWFPRFGPTYAWNIYSLSVAFVLCVTMGNQWGCLACCSFGLSHPSVMPTWASNMFWWEGPLTWPFCLHDKRKRERESALVGFQCAGDEGYSWLHILCYIYIYLFND